jgi:hypothetical protein
MIQKLKASLFYLATLLVIGMPVLAPVGALAATGTSQSDINTKLKCGSNIDLSNATQNDNCNSNTSDNGRDAGAILRTVINVLSVIVGALAVIMIIIAGFRYVTSGGSDAGVGAAKKTIMYALIGLVVVALAQVIVHFVLNNIT